MKIKNANGFSFVDVPAGQRPSGLAEQLGIVAERPRQQPAGAVSDPIEAAIGRLSAADRELLKDPKNEAVFRQKAQEAHAALTAERQKETNIAEAEETRATRFRLETLAKAAVRGDSK